MSDKEYQIRFRLPAGDIGPIPFPTRAASSVLKQKLFEAWPEVGPVAQEKPNDISEIRLICCGRFMEDRMDLSSLSKSLGAPSPDLIVTMHVVIRQPLSASKGYAQKSEKAGATGCCVIS